MSPPTTPEYADFDDYRKNQRVVVVVRWFLLAAWLFVINYREPFTTTLLFIDAMGAFLVVLNALLTVRVIQGKPISARRALLLSVMDLTVIATGIAITGNRIGNTYFIMYYPALIGLSLTYPEPLVAFGLGTVAIGAYVAVSTALPPGLNFDEHGERVLIIRVIVMYAVIAASVLMYRNEWQKRRAAVGAVHEESARNLELERRAQQAEQAAQMERQRLAREIHDGVAQSVYALALNLEAASEAASSEGSGVALQLQRLVPLARQTLLETRHYIFDLKPLISDNPDLTDLAQAQAREFTNVAGLPVRVAVEGNAEGCSVTVAAGFYRVLRECLANVMKHSRATSVSVTLRFSDASVLLIVQDDGQGFDPAMAPRGYGLQGVRERVAELGGTVTVSSSPGQGAVISASLPLRR